MRVASQTRYIHGMTRDELLTRIRTATYEDIGRALNRSQVTARHLRRGIVGGHLEAQLEALLRIIGGS